MHLRLQIVSNCRDYVFVSQDPKDQLLLGQVHTHTHTHTKTKVINTHTCTHIHWSLCTHTLIHILSLCDDNHTLSSWHVGRHFLSGSHLFTCSPAYATPKLLDRLGLQLSNIDIFEYHEAFAVSIAQAPLNFFLRSSGAKGIRKNG